MRYTFCCIDEDLFDFMSETIDRKFQQNKYNKLKEFIEAKNDTSELKYFNSLVGVLGNLKVKKKFGKLLQKGDRIGFTEADNYIDSRFKTPSDMAQDSFMQLLSYFSSYNIEFTIERLTYYNDYVEIYAVFCHP